MTDVVEFTIFGDPVAFARAGSFGKRRFTPPKQRDYMLAVRAEAHRVMGARAPLDGPLTMSVEASYKYPATWSKKRRSTTYWKQSRPDADNLAKAVMDCIGKNDSLAQADRLPAALIYGDDAQIVRIVAQKHYGARAYVRVSVRAAPAVSLP